MLTWLRNKERDIASTAIVMFVGSWLLLFCQTCFATSQDADSTNFSQSEIIDDCHTIVNDTDKPEEPYSFDDDHCLGVCDCDEVAVSLNNIERAGHSDKFQKVFLDSIPVSKSFKDKIVSTLTSHIFPIPERAILHPLQRYALLLI